MYKCKEVPIEDESENRLGVRGIGVRSEEAHAPEIGCGRRLLVHKARFSPTEAFRFRDWK